MKTLGNVAILDYSNSCVHICSIDCEIDTEELLKKLGLNEDSILLWDFNNIYIDPYSKEDSLIEDSSYIIE